MKNSKTISARVYYNKKPAGILEKRKGIYAFTYDREYVNASGSRPISITMPLSEKSYISKELFPVFMNMLSEGANKKMQCRLLKIDENDYFSLLIETAKEDSIGPITVKQIDEPSGN